MPRKQRIEYPGAVYHVISRGNYRKDLFASPTTSQAFEKAIFQTVERCGWNLYAYVLMSNHYHLAFETPEPNLVDGMKWLQGTFATRFNRFNGERGHVFEGRYKSLLVEEDRPLLGLIDYIHLNPVRANLCKIETLKDYRFGSYFHYWKRNPPIGLKRDEMLALLGAKDSVTGMKSYLQHLKICDEADPKNRDALYLKFCRGWYIGSKKGKKELSKELVQKHPTIDWEGVDIKELNESKWEPLIVKELKKRKKTETDIQQSLKGAPWKVEVAKLIRTQTTASNPWIAKRLNMGHPSRVSNLIRGSGT